MQKTPAKQFPNRGSDEDADLTPKMNYKQKQMKPSQYILRHVTHQLEESVSDEFDEDDMKEKASTQSEETLVAEYT